jgi:hypothetical protein
MTPSYQEIRNLIERRFRRRLLFVLHFVAFMTAVLATAWWISTHWVYPGDWKNLAYLGGWGALVFIHWLYYNLANRRDCEIESAWERVYGEARRSDTDDYPAYISDDGELIDWTDEPDRMMEKVKHGDTR